MSMSKKDFIALGDTISDFRFQISDFNSRNPENPFTHPQLGALARFCRDQNSAFMPARWLDYIEGKCGPSGGKIK